MLSSSSLTELDKKASIPNQVHDNFDENLLKLFICNKCQEGFESGQELVAHVTLVHEEKAISESELNGLVENKTVESLQNEQEKLASKNDKSEMLSSPILKQNSEGNAGSVHEEKKHKHQCEICQHNFKFKAALKKHIKIVHEKKKPFHCSFCEKSFSAKSSLKGHLATVHAGENLNFIEDAIELMDNEKPFECQFCGKTFCSKPGLKRHIASAHEEKKKHYIEEIRKSINELDGGICVNKFGNSDKLEHTTPKAPEKVKKEKVTSSAIVTLSDRGKASKYFKNTKKLGYCMKPIKKEVTNSLKNDDGFSISDVSGNFSKKSINPTFKEKSPGRNGLNKQANIKKNKMSEEKLQMLNKNNVTIKKSDLSKDFVKENNSKTDIQKIHENKKLLIDKYIFTVRTTSETSEQNAIFMCSICNAEFPRLGIAEGHVFMEHVLGIKNLEPVLSKGCDIDNQNTEDIFGRESKQNGSKKNDFIVKSALNGQNNQERLRENVLYNHEEENISSDKTETFVLESNQPQNNVIEVDKDAMSNQGNELTKEKFEISMNFDSSYIFDPNESLQKSLFDKNLEFHNFNATLNIGNDNYVEEHQDMQDNPDIQSEIGETYADDPLTLNEQIVQKDVQAKQSEQHEQTDEHVKNDSIVVEIVQLQVVKDEGLQNHEQESNDEHVQVEQQDQINEPAINDKLTAPYEEIKSEPIVGDEQIINHVCNRGETLLDHGGLQLRELGQNMNDEQCENQDHLDDDSLAQNSEHPSNDEQVQIENEEIEVNEVIVSDNEVIECNEKLKNHDQMENNKREHLEEGKYKHLANNKHLDNVEQLTNDEQLGNDKKIENDLGESMEPIVDKPITPEEDICDAHEGHCNKGAQEGKVGQTIIEEIIMLEKKVAELKKKVLTPSDTNKKVEEPSVVSSTLLTKSVNEDRDKSKEEYISSQVSKSHSKSRNRLKNVLTPSDNDKKVPSCNSSIPSTNEDKCKSEEDYIPPQAHKSQPKSKTRLKKELTPYRNDKKVEGPSENSPIPSTNEDKDKCEGKNKANKSQTKSKTKLDKNLLAKYGANDIKIASLARVQLKRNICVQNNDGKWICKICEDRKKIATKTNLLRHYVLHGSDVCKIAGTKIEKFACKHCGKSFNQKYNLKVHDRKHHMDVLSSMDIGANFEANKNYSIKIADPEKSVLDIGTKVVEIAFTKEKKNAKTSPKPMTDRENKSLDTLGCSTTTIKDQTIQCKSYTDSFMMLYASSMSNIEPANEKQSALDLENCRDYKKNITEFKSQTLARDEMKSKSNIETSKENSEVGINDIKKIEKDAMKKVMRKATFHGVSFFYEELMPDRIKNSETKVVSNEFKTKTIEANLMVTSGANDQKIKEGKDKFKDKNRSPSPEYCFSKETKLRNNLNASLIAKYGADDKKIGSLTRVKIKRDICSKNRDGKWVCKICEDKKTFYNRSNLQRHYILHGSDACKMSGGKVNKFTCTYCDKNFNQKSGLMVHERTHTGVKPYSCKICNKKFSVPTNLIKHERIHSGEKPYSCNYCNKKSLSKQSMQKHERIHTGEKPFACKYCDKTFNESSNLTVHEKRHTGKLPLSECRFCNKTFNSKTNLDQHERIHTGEKPHQCKVCNKAFRQFSALSTHKLRHTRDIANLKSTDVGKRNETTEIAKESKKEFQAKSNVKTIDKTIHRIANSRAKINSKSTDDGTRNKKKEIAKKFKKKFQIKSVARDEKTYNQKNHSIGHEIKYSCMICDKTFSNKTNLQRHYIVHGPDACKMTGTKLLKSKCNHCDQTFNYKFNMIRHEKLKHGIIKKAGRVLPGKEAKKFSCTKCDQSFNYRFKAIQHERLKHGI